MINIAINILGDAEVMRKLKNLGNTWLEWKDALDESGKNLTAYFGGQVFDSMGGVYGTPWATLSPSTQAQKALHYPQYAAVPLMRTGTMRGSFTHNADSVHVVIENTAPYFVYHQSTAPRTRLPRRPIFEVNDDVKTIVSRAFRKAALAKMAGL